MFKLATTQSIHSTCSNLQNVLVVHVQYVIFTGNNRIEDSCSPLLWPTGIKIIHDDCSQNEHECFVRFS
jgi:hypothetical protein